MKQLSDDSKAVGLFIRGSSEAHVSVNWADPRFEEVAQRARDLWLHRVCFSTENGSPLLRLRTV